MAHKGYKGDSPGKKVTRFRMWMNNSALMGMVGIPHVGSFVLAGDGGDIAVLDSFEIPRDKIYAVDFEIDKLKLCHDKYPGIHIFNEEAGLVSKNLTDKYNSVHLDFCGRLSAKNILTYADVERNMSFPGFIFVTLLKGRERIDRKGSKELLWGNCSRGARRDLLRFYQKRSDHLKDNSSKCVLGLAKHILSMRDGERFDPKIALSWSEKRYRFVFKNDEKTPKNLIIPKTRKLSPLGQGMIRIDALQKSALIVNELRRFERMRKNLPISRFDRDVDIRIGSIMTYHSKTKKDHGTPFVCGTVFYSSIEKMKEIRNALLNNFLRLSHFDSKESMSQLKSIILSSSKTTSTHCLSEIFGIPKGTISAWKAHSTMGNYTNDYIPAFKISSKEEDMYGGERIGVNWGSIRAAVRKDASVIPSHRPSIKTKVLKPPMFGKKHCSKSTASLVEKGEQEDVNPNK
tara:strand:- start:71 stop:1447 length:1377 start_codon:yes stop_codon:yes gene_type:complete